MDVPVADGGHGDHHPVEGGGDVCEAGVEVHLYVVAQTKKYIRQDEGQKKQIQAIMQLMDLEKMRPEIERIIPKRASSGPLWTKV